MQLQQSDDPTSSQWTVPTHLDWAGPGELAYTVTGDIVTARKVKGSNRLEASDGVFIVFFCYYYFCISFIHNWAISLSSRCWCGVFKLFSQPLWRRTFPVQGTVYCRTTLGCGAECLLFCRAHRHPTGTLQPSLTDQFYYLSIYLFKRLQIFSKITCLLVSQSCSIKVVYQCEYVT